MCPATKELACPACGGELPAGLEPCPHCHVAAAWIDLLQAFDFVQQRLEYWRQQGLVRKDQFAAVTIQLRERQQQLLAEARRGKEPPPCRALQLTPLGRCWSCNDPEVSGSYCDCCGAPAAGADVRTLRHWEFLGHEVKRWEEMGQLSLACAHRCLADVKEQIAILRLRLEAERIPEVIAVPETAARVEQPPVRKRPRLVPQRSFWELLLDPRSIQWLLAFGGGLLVLGLVIWLATLGIFENPVVLAVILGTGNTALLGGGWAIITRTRYQTAGRALTLLACLVMPLNLWFYHAQQLITLEGHLWVAALVCCVLYAASALVLRDPLFVYVLMGGVAMTGLLILCDLGKFTEIAAPSTLLVVLGLIGIHAERAFPAVAETFSRKRFGLAFFWSGHALLGAGLLLLFGAHLAGDWLYEPVFRSLYEARGFGQPAVVTELAGQLLALTLVLAGTYAFLYSDLVVRRVGVYIYLAAFTVLWAEVLLVRQLQLDADAVITVLAVTALVVNLLQMNLGRDATYLRSVPVLGLSLSLLPVLIGIVLHLRATSHLEPMSQWSYEVSWGYVCAMLVTALCCRSGAYLYRHTVPWVSACYFFATAAASLVSAAGLLSLLNLATWDAQAPILMLFPLAYMTASRLYRGHSAEQPLVWVAHAATAVMLVSSLGTALEEFTTPVSHHSLNLTLSLFCAEASAFYVLAAAFRKQGFNVYLATAMACGAVWQLLNYWGIDAEYYTLAFALLGVGLLIAYRLAVLEQFVKAGLAGAAFQSANALLSLSFLASLFITLSRLASGAVKQTHDWSVVGLALTLFALSLVATSLVRHEAWRRWYVVMAVAEAALAFLAIHVLSHLSPWQKLEVFCVICGVALLVAGHVGWHREQGRHSDLVSLSLSFGSVLVGLPLAIAVLVYRFEAHFSVPNEFGLLTAGVLLLATGFVFQLRSTTLTGAALVTLYLVTLVLYINALEKLSIAAVWLALAGAAIFTCAILLSVYRDRLLMLPEKVKRREGVFRVLGWR